MGKSVYLFELDSVRKTDEEVAVAQEALYDEIINNGNRVILSYNQLTDSRLIASMLQGDTKTGNRSIRQMLELFNAGWLAFSRFGDARTPSQYLQNSIRTNLAPRNDKFVYSGIPLKSTQRRLMRLTLEALQNADASVFTEFIQPDESHETASSQSADDELLALFAEYEPRGSGYVELKTEIDIQEARETLSLLKTYVQFILALSLDETTANPSARHQPETMGAYRLPKLVDVACSIDPPSGLEYLWESAVHVLGPEGGLPDDVRRSNGRSNWLEAIKELKAAATDRLPYCLAALIVNLCYNYIVEHSIFGASKHYDAAAFVRGEYGSFADDFRSRVAKDWRDGIQDPSRFLPDESAAHKHFNVDVDKWERGLRILERRKTPPTTFLNVDRGTTAFTQLRSSDLSENAIRPAAGDTVRMYEDGREQQRHAQVRDNNKRLWASIGITVLTLVLVFALGQAEGLVENLSNFNVVLTSLVLFFGFAAIEKIVDAFVPESDIVANIANIGRGVADLAHNSKHDVKSHFNRLNVGTAKEKLPRIDDPLYARTPSMKRYDALRRTQRELFESEEPEEIEILGMGESDVIQGQPAPEFARDYETRTGANLGVRYESPYHLMVVDLVRWKSTGAIGSYERLVPAVPNAGVVIAPKFQGKWVFLKQFRHALRKHQLCFPRGFGEMGPDGQPLADALNAVKELQEELGASVVGTPQVIGSVAPDSGILGKVVTVCYAELQALDATLREEGICDVVLMDDAEVAAAVKNRRIDDGYTLSALTLAGAM